MQKYKTIVAFAVCFSIIFPMCYALACGPFFNVYLDTPQDLDALIWYPTPPDSTISASYPGIIFAKTRAQYLYPIYRDLVGKKLSSEAQKAVFSYLDHGLSNNAGTPFETAITDWQNARKQVAGDSGNMSSYSFYANGYLNCLPDSFVRATKTLQERQAVYSKDQLASWVKNQDDVFAVCMKTASDSYPYNSGSSPNVQAGTGAPHAKTSFWQSVKDFFSMIWQKLFGARVQSGSKLTEVSLSQDIKPTALFGYDKTYQDAAKLLYGGNLPAAKDAFEAIAKDSANPWRAYGALALGRVELRMAMFNYYNNPSSFDSYGYPSSSDPAIQAQAKAQFTIDLQKPKAQFESILKDDKLTEVHDAAKALLELVNIKSDPSGQLLESESVLLSSDDPDQIVKSLDAYVAILHENPNLISSGSDFSRWANVWAHGNSDQTVLDNGYAKNKSLPWLLAMVRFAAPNTLSPSLLHTIPTISGNSAGFWTLHYYELQYLINSGRSQEAKTSLDSLMSQHQVSGAVANYMNDLRMQLSSSLTEYFSYAQRNITYIDSDYNDHQIPDKRYQPINLIDKKAKYAIENLLPLDQLVSLASQNNVFNQQNAKQLRMITFVRAYILGNVDDAKKMATLLSASDTNLVAGLKDFISATNYGDQQFAGAVFLLHSPGISSALNLADDNLAGGWAGELGRNVKDSDPYRQNWWTCNDVRANPYDVNGNNPDVILDNNPVLDPAKKLLSATQLVKAKAESETIYSTIAPDYLGNIVNKYAVTHLQDSRIPEALHLVVDAGHHAQCKDENTTPISAQSFNILHNNYPGNSWTQKTPFYY